MNANQRALQGSSGMAAAPPEPPLAGRAGRRSQGHPAGSQRGGVSPPPPPRPRLLLGPRTGQPPRMPSEGRGGHLPSRWHPLRVLQRGEEEIFTRQRWLSLGLAGLEDPCPHVPPQPGGRNAPGPFPYISLHPERLAALLSLLASSTQPAENRISVSVIGRSSG